MHFVQLCSLWAGVSRFVSKEVLRSASFASVIRGFALFWRDLRRVEADSLPHFKSPVINDAFTSCQSGLNLIPAMERPRLALSWVHSVRFLVDRWAQLASFSGSRAAFAAFVKITTSGIAAQPVPQKSECHRFLDHKYWAGIGDRSRLDSAALPGVTFHQS